MTTKTSPVNRARKAVADAHTTTQAAAETVTQWQAKAEAETAEAAQLEADSGTLVLDGEDPAEIQAKIAEHRSAATIATNTATAAQARHRAALRIELGAEADLQEAIARDYDQQIADYDRKLETLLKPIRELAGVPGTFEPDPDYRDRRTELARERYGANREQAGIRAYLAWVAQSPRPNRTFSHLEAYPHDLWPDVRGKGLGMMSGRILPDSVYSAFPILGEV
ncbi:hypothetical protein [Brevibacterium moorei]|uniref:hypothetical protein n=1 Tax=Brevibacterium moorei TaxID=2968457 RepID=UPI00211C119E|nr:hypothetical protein [Brevibacterium sp. 68QC2CO]MCQ9386809.1 hypothetical protein [Brevibacterium sp. 68QC2CO]